MANRGTSVEVYKVPGMKHINVIKSTNKSRWVKGFLVLSRWYQSVTAILCVVNLLEPEFYI